jgi:hypothetical protein
MKNTFYQCPHCNMPVLPGGFMIDSIDSVSAANEYIGKRTDWMVVQEECFFCVVPIGVANEGGFH